MSYSVLERNGKNIYSNADKPIFTKHDHGYLFDFVAEDLSEIDVLLNSFFLEQFDFNQLKLKDNSPLLNEDKYAEAQKSNQIIDINDYYLINPHLQGILAFLKEIHPYYKTDKNALAALEEIVIDYFNNFISYNEIVFSPKKYEAIVLKLLTIPPLRIPIRPMLETTLDEVNPHIRALYNNYIRIYDSSKFKNLRREIKKGKDVDRQHSSHIANEQQKISKLMVNILEATPSGTNRSVEETTVEFTVKITAVVKDDNVHEKLNTENLSQFLMYEIIGMAKAGLKTKKCKYCKKYFIEEDKRVNYCNRPADGEKTCADIGPNKLFLESKEEDKMYNAYRLAYVRNRTRKNRETITEEEFNYWNEKAKHKKDTNSSDFDEWLNLSRIEIKSKFKNNS